MSCVACLVRWREGEEREGKKEVKKQKRKKRVGCREREDEEEGRVKVERK